MFSVLCFCAAWIVLDLLCSFSMFFHADKAPEGVFVDGSGSVRGVQCRAQGTPRAKEAIGEGLEVGGSEATVAETLGSSCRRTPLPRWPRCVNSTWRDDSLLVNPDANGSIGYPPVSWTLPDSTRASTA